MFHGRNIRWCLVIAPLILIFPADAVGQQPPDKPTAEEYHESLDKSYKADQAAKAAKAEADAAKKSAESKQSEVDKLKDQQKQDQDKLDTDGKVKQLDGEIAEIQKKLDIIDKTEQDVVNNITNPGDHKKLPDDQDKLRQEALGGSSVPTAPHEIRDSFDKKKQQLEDELKRKKQELEDAKKKAAEQKANPATTAQLEKQIADREAEIKAKEAELEKAKSDAEQAEQARKDAAASAAEADSEFRKLQAERRKQDALDAARKKLKEAEEQLERAKAALEKKQAELDRNSELAKQFAEVLRLVNKLKELLDELTGQDADPTGSLEKGAKLLEEIDKLLNDPESYFQRLKNMLTEAEFELLRKAIHGLRNAENELRDLLKRQKIGNEPRQTRSVRYSPALDRATLLQSPTLELQSSVATQMYAALERAVSQGDLEGVRRIAAFDYGDSSRHADGSTSQWSTINAMTEDDIITAQRETELVAMLGKHIVNAVLTMQQRAVEIRTDIQAAAGDPVQLAKAVQPQSSSVLSNDRGIAEFQLTKLDDQFSTTIYRAFQGEIARALAAAAGPPVSGASVVKGNARTSTGTAVPSVMLTLSDVPSQDPSQPNSQSPAAERTVAVQPDANGQFEVTVPPGSQIRRMQLGGPDLLTRTLVVPTPNRHAPAWLDPQLDDAGRQATRQRYQAMDLILESAIAGLPDQPSAGPLHAPIVRELFNQLAADSPPSGTANGSRAPWFEAFLGQSDSPDDPAGQLSRLVGEAMAGLGSPQAGERLQADPNSGPRGDVNGDGIMDIIVASNPAGGGAAAEAVFSNFLKIEGVRGEFDVAPIAQRLLTSHYLEMQSGADIESQPSQQMRQQTLQSLQTLLQQFAPGARVDLTLLASSVDLAGTRNSGGSNATANPSQLVTQEFTFRITDANGNPVAVDRNQLQSALDQHPTLGGNSGVALPRDAQATPNDPHFTATGSWGEVYADQWALKRVGFGPVDGGQPSAWPTEPSSLTPCVVAVIGSGVDWTHPELQGQMWINLSENPWNGRDDDGNGYVDDQFGWNFRDNNSDVMDTGGHDTHVAGVIAARSNNGYGIAGANPAARIMALKAANYLGHADAVSIANAIRYAVNNGARIINISYGGDRSSPLEQRAIEYAASHGVLVIAAAGNQGVDAKDYAIANSPLALTVAGSTTDDQRAGFSNWGQPVDLTAPAMDILSLRARGTDFLLYTGENPNYTSETAVVGNARDLYRASGTSFAAPLVSGAASLLYSRNPDLTAVQVRNMLLMTAEDVDVAGFDQNTGAGILSTTRAVSAEPAHVLLPQIAGVAAARRDGRTVVEVTGRVEASGESDRWLQVAFGESPRPDDWTTISHVRSPGATEGLLGTIPAAQFSRAGVWSIRVLAQDGTKSIRQARATLTTQ